MKIEIPDHLKCPLTLDLMYDPVNAPDGRTYERTAIVQWLRSNGTSPYTRKVMHIHQLLPNMSMKVATEVWCTEHEQPIPIAPAVEDRTPDVLQLKITPSTQNAGTRIASVLPPKEHGLRAAIDVICVLDVSGSMDTNASIGGEKFNLTLLDMARHAASVFAHVLGPDDRLGLVTFSTEAKKILDLTNMNDAGRKKASDLIEGIRVAGTTNLGAGLQTALKMYKEDGNDSRPRFIVALTDGQPNAGDNEDDLVKSYVTKQNVNCVVHTMGLGFSSIDSKLLEAIAIAGNGSTAYIPDSGFIGTIFTHLIGNMLATIARDVEVIFEPLENGKIEEVVGQDTYTTPSGEVVVRIGTMSHGQPKHLVLRVSDGASDVSGQVSFVPANSAEGTTVASTFEELEESIFNRNHARSHFAKYLQGLVTTRDQSSQWGGRQSRTSDKPNYKGTKAIERIIQDEPDMMQELKTEVRDAVEKANFSRWGMCYLPSLASAHRNQERNNGKDPAVQSYGGKLFEQLVDEANEVFNEMAPPKPTGRATSNTKTVTSMCMLNNASNGCVHENSMVLLANGMKKKARHIVKGDLVATENGKFAPVTCVLRTVCPNGRTTLVRINELWLTTYHPISLDGKTYQFPIDVGTVHHNIPCDAVYSYIVEGSSAMIIDGIQTITLEHGITDDLVAAHPYFGTTMEDVRAMPGFKSGLVNFDFNSDVRDKDTGLIVGLTGSQTAVAVTN